MTEALERPSDEPSDAALIGAVRRGDTSAYGLLYRRHVGAARRASTCLAATASEREDLVAEAFTRVLRVLRAGRGPVEDFRPYLLVTMRNAAINISRRSPAMSLYGDLPDAMLHAPGDDPFSARLHVEVATAAFASLPERWRMVLWHTEIEGESPADIAPMLGMSPNSVAALAYRAREGLRQAYLQAHLPPTDRKDCRAVVDKLAGWVRRSISPVTMRRITVHLDRCPRCRELATGLVKINEELRGLLAPIVLGAPFAAAYLHAALPTAVPAAALATAGGACGAGGTSTSAASAASAVKTALTAAACKVGATVAIAASTAAAVAVGQQPDVPLDGAAPVSAPVPDRTVKPVAQTDSVRAAPGAVSARPAAAAPAVAPGEQRVAKAKAVKKPAHRAAKADRKANSDPGKATSRGGGKHRKPARGGMWARDFGDTGGPGREFGDADQPARWPGMADQRADRPR